MWLVHHVLWHHFLDNLSLVSSITEVHQGVFRTGKHFILAINTDTMGLFWKSDAPVSVHTPKTAENSNAATQQQSPIQGAPPAPADDAPQPKYKKALSRDELAEKELQDMLSEIAEADKPIQPKYKRNAVLPPIAGSRPSQQDSSLTLEDSLYPTDMSCREAFDSAFYCQSMGGQFNALYRYGGIQSCSEHWKSFWFCMRSKSYPDEVRGPMIRDHYKKRDLKYKLGPSSEDIWEGREKKLDWGEAFARSVDELLPNETNKEYNERERKRREGRAAGTI